MKTFREPSQKKVFKFCGQVFNSAYSLIVKRNQKRNMKTSAASFTCSDSTGIFRFECDAIPSIDDMNTILGCVAEDDADFQRLVELSTT